MGKINDLKEQVFGDFLKWLDEKKIGDAFSNDVWAAVLFERLFQIYKQEAQTNSVKNELLLSLTNDELLSVIELRNNEQNKTTNK